MKKELSNDDKIEVLRLLEDRFEKNISRHKNIDFSEVLAKLEINPDKIWSLNMMELSGGEPDVVDFDEESEEFIFIDCSKESPLGRRSLCYDRKALDSRRTNKPINSALDFANEIGVSILTENEYKLYHKLVAFDTKTSSWVLTPDEIRDLGGAIFCDFRFGRVFTYHNGAESYYAVRGFRGMLRV